MTTEEAKVREYPAVIALIWLNITSFLFWNIMPFLVGGFVDVLGYSPELAGRISTVQLTATMVVLGFSAMTVHRWNLRQAALTGAILAFFADFSAAFLQNAALIIMTRVISGLSMGVIVSAALAAISKLRNPTRVYSIGAAGLSISGFGWYLTLPWLLENTGMKGPFIGIAAFSLVAIPLTLAWFPRFRSQGDVPSDQHGLFGMLTAPVLLLASGLLIQTTTFGGIWAYWERIGVHSGLSAEGIGTVFALGSVSGMFGGLLAAWIAGKIGNAIALITGFLVMGAGIAIALFYSPAAYFVATMIFYAAGILVAFLFSRYVC